MTPAERAAFIAAAKRHARFFVGAVRRGSAHDVQRSWKAMAGGEQRALCVLLAEAADWGRLRVVLETEDDGMPWHVRQRPEEASAA